MVLLTNMALLNGTFLNIILVFQVHQGMTFLFKFIMISLNSPIAKIISITAILIILIFISSHCLGITIAILAALSKSMFQISYDILENEFKIENTGLTISLGMLSFVQ